MRRWRVGRRWTDVEDSDTSPLPRDGVCVRDGRRWTDLWKMGKIPTVNVKNSVTPVTFDKWTVMDRGTAVYQSTCTVKIVCISIRPYIPSSGRIL